MHKPRRYGCEIGQKTRTGQFYNQAEPPKAISAINRFVENDEQNLGTVKTLKETRTRIKNTDQKSRRKGRF